MFIKTVIASASTRFDSIDTLVMFFATAASFLVPVGDHVVRTRFQYPVHLSQFYKQRSSHMRSVKLCPIATEDSSLKFCYFLL